MSVPHVNLTQALVLHGRPFRDNIFDYSNLSNASVLDAFAASFLVLALTAVVVRLAALLLGMNTRSVVVGSLLERYLIPNIFCFAQLFTGCPKKKKRNRTYVSSQLTAGLFLLLLLVVQVLLILSSMPVSENIKLEELQIRWPKFSPYKEDLARRQISSNCFFFYSAQRSVTVSGLNFCIFESSSETTVKAKNGLKAFIKMSPMNLGLTYGCENNGHLTEKAIVIPLQHGIVPTAVNISRIVSNATELTTWLGQRVQPLLGCSRFSVSTKIHRDIEMLVDEVRLENCEQISKDSCEEVVDRVMFSALRFSNSFLTRNDFVQKDLEEGIYQLQPVITPKGIDWDKFARFRRTRIPGYIIWLVAIFMFFVNIVLAACAPDLQYARQIAASQFLQLGSIPAELRDHIKLSS